MAKLRGCCGESHRGVTRRAERLSFRSVPPATGGVHATTATRPSALEGPSIGQCSEWCSLRCGGGRRRIAHPRLPVPAQVVDRVLLLLLDVVVSLLQPHLTTVRAIQVLTVVDIVGELGSTQEVARGWTRTPGCGTGRPAQRTSVRRPGARPGPAGYRKGGWRRKSIPVISGDLGSAAPVLTQVLHYNDARGVERGSGFLGHSGAP